MTTNSGHVHSTNILISSGKLEVAGKHINFLEGHVYLDFESLEQRVCLTLVELPEARLIRSATKPFASIHLDKAFLIGNFPITHLKVFLLSATISGRKIDVVISPTNEKLATLLRQQI